LRDLGDSEVGGFGITAADDLLYVESVELVRQVCTGVSVAFDDQSPYQTDPTTAGRQRPENWHLCFPELGPATAAVFFLEFCGFSEVCNVRSVGLYACLCISDRTLDNAVFFC
jgi:hypothetical protein